MIMIGFVIVASFSFSPLDQEGKNALELALTNAGNFHHRTETWKREVRCVVLLWRAAGLDLMPLARKKILKRLAGNHVSLQSFVEVIFTESVASHPVQRPTQIELSNFQLKSVWNAMSTRYLGDPTSESS
jgi:hypothetical protein